MDKSRARCVFVIDGYLSFSIAQLSLFAVTLSVKFYNLTKMLFIKQVSHECKLEMGIKNWNCEILFNYLDL